MIPPEGEGGHDPGQSSQEMQFSGHDYNQGDVGGGGYDYGQNSQTEQMEEEDVGGGSYESGQNSQTEHMEEGDEDAAEAAADDVFQEMMEEEDEDGGSAYGHDSDESDDEHVVPNPASWSHDFSSSMTVNICKTQSLSGQCRLARHSKPRCRVKNI